MQTKNNKTCAITMVSTMPQLNQLRRKIRIEADKRKESETETEIFHK